MTARMSLWVDCGPFGKDGIGPQITREVEIDIERTGLETGSIVRHKELAVTALSALLLTLAVPPPPQDQSPVADWACANPLIDRHSSELIQGGDVARERIGALATRIQLECARPYGPGMGHQVQYRIRVTLFEIQIAATISHRLREARGDQPSLDQGCRSGLRDPIELLKTLRA